MVGGGEGEGAGGGAGGSRSSIQLLCQPERQIQMDPLPWPKDARRWARAGSNQLALNSMARSTASSEGKQRAGSSTAHLIQQVGRVLLLGALLLGALLLGVTVTRKGQSRRRVMATSNGGKEKKKESGDVCAHTGIRQVSQGSIGRTSRETHRRSYPSC